MNGRAVATIVAGIDAFVVGVLVYMGQFGSAAFLALFVMIICAHIASGRD